MLSPAMAFFFLICVMRLVVFANIYLDRNEARIAFPRQVCSCTRVGCGNRRGLLPKAV